MIKMRFFYLMTVLITSNLLFAQSHKGLNKKELKEINNKQIQEIDSLKFLIEKAKTENNILNQLTDSLNFKVKKVEQLNEKLLNDLNQEMTSNILLKEYNSRLSQKLASTFDSIKIRTFFSSNMESLNIDYDLTKLIFTKGSISERIEYYKKIFKVICLNEMRQKPEIQKIDVVKLGKYYDVIIGDIVFSELDGNSIFKQADSVIDLFLKTKEPDIIFNNRGIFSTLSTGLPVTNIPCFISGDLILCNNNQQNLGWMGELFVFNVLDNVSEIRRINHKLNIPQTSNSKLKKLAGMNFRVKEEHQDIKHFYNNIYSFEIPLERDKDANCCPSYYLKVKTKYVNHKFEIIDDFYWSDDSQSNNWRLLN
jgi:hypothetical protein